MAVDEALLAAAAKENIVTLRLYQWSEPTLSLGYFQRYAERDRHAASRNVAVVRRPSGGGAILHDRELTYSLTIPAAHPWARDTQRLYLTLHRKFVTLLARLLGPRGTAWKFQVRDHGDNPPADEDPFLCFQRCAPGDVVVTALDQEANGAIHKIIGSAQRRRGAVLQHGSILLGTSSAAPELVGLSDLTGVEVSPERLASELLSPTDGLLGCKVQPVPLPPEVQSAASQLAREKYSNRQWTERR